METTNTNEPLTCRERVTLCDEMRALGRALKAAGSPTTGTDAARFWELSASSALPAIAAAEIMRDAGYVPFEGFPLVTAAVPQAAPQAAPLVTVNELRDGRGTVIYRHRVPRDETNSLAASPRLRRALFNRLSRRAGQCSRAGICALDDAQWHAIRAQLLACHAAQGAA